MGERSKAAEIQREQFSAFKDRGVSSVGAVRAQAAVIFVVFGMTGSTSVALVRPLFEAVLGGPWPFRPIV